MSAKNLRIQTKILITLIVLSVVLIISINGGVIWWSAKQYKQEQLQNQQIINQTFLTSLQLHTQEMSFLREGITRDNKFFKVCKCYIKALRNKKIKKCAKKLLTVDIKGKSKEELKQLLYEQITNESNPPFFYMQDKNPYIKVFDLFFKGKTIWSRNAPQNVGLETDSQLLKKAREVKKRTCCRIYCGRWKATPRSARLAIP